MGWWGAIATVAVSECAAVQQGCLFSIRLDKTQRKNKDRYSVLIVKHKENIRDLMSESKEIQSAS